MEGSVDKAAGTCGIGITCTYQYTASFDGLQYAIDYAIGVGVPLIQVEKRGQIGNMAYGQNCGHAYREEIRTISLQP